MSLRPTITTDDKGDAAIQRRLEAHNAATGDDLSPSQFIALHAEAMVQGWASTDHAARLQEIGNAIKDLPQEDLDRIADYALSLTL